MIEIRIHGRGGQGGVTLAKLLAAAEHREGRSVQAFGIYAAERSGAPLQAFLRCDDRPIHNPNMIYEPDHIIVLDPTLIARGILDGLKPGGYVLLNSDREPEHFAASPAAAPFRIATVDASAIARRHVLGSRAVPIVNTALAGATARILHFSLQAILEALEEMDFHGSNLAAARQAYAEVRIADHTPRPVARKPMRINRRRVPGLLNGNRGDFPTIHTGLWASRQPAPGTAIPPCNAVCPAGNDVQGFLAALADGNVDRALDILLRTSPLPAVCGRVCPGFCMQQCNRRELDGAVNVRDLERYAGDHGETEVSPAQRRPQRVAIIGAGPAGLSAAWQLARLGYSASLFEAGAETGGLMRTGIPTYRLPRTALDRDIQRILDTGVACHLNHPVDRPELGRLSREFDAVLVATGLQRLTSLDLGTEAVGLLQGLEFLDHAREGRTDVAGERVVVVGGGNTAVDAARTAWRLGAKEVRILYRRTRAEMPAIAAEIDEAEDEGVHLDFLCAPLKITRPGPAFELHCQRMELGPPGADGRRRPVPLEGQVKTVSCDRVILALGQAPDLSLLPGEAPPETDRPMAAPGGALVYAAGDLLRNEGTVTAAIGGGRETALRLHAHFSGSREWPVEPGEKLVVRADQLRFNDFVPRLPDHGRIVPIEERSGSFAEVHQGLHGPEEAQRCLSCGVCNACDRCVTWCPDGVLRREGSELVFDYDYCKGCGVCVTECSRAAIYMKAG